jgi:prepilin-type N-terminal cleavage/methylation domain-containing protein
MKKIRSAFSLIELMVVIAIIAILTTMGVSSFSSAVKKSRDARRLSDLHNLAQALVMYRADFGGYPTSTDGNGVIGSGSTAGSVFGAKFLGGGYIRAQNFPIPPLATKGETYVYTPTGAAKDFVICTGMPLEQETSTAANACNETGETTTCALVFTHYCIWSP